MSKKVLVIEDEQNIIEALNFILARDGWSVVCHSNGANANEKIALTKPDVLILDTMLPDKSGLDILADLRAQPETAALPVLMLTARGQAKDRKTAMALGATAYMTKPFSNADLLAKMKAMSEVELS